MAVAGREAGTRASRRSYLDWVVGTLGEAGGLEGVVEVVSEVGDGHRQVLSELWSE